MEGVPPLIDLAERLDIKFTFFLHVGRSISLRHQLFGKKKTIPNCAASLPARKKLGFKQFLYTALINPKIGPTAPEIVKRIFESQELGLHGGTNHDLWHHGADQWSREKIEQDIKSSLAWLADLGIKVQGFSSPGWTDTPHLVPILENLGFQYRADRHGEKETEVVTEGNRLLNIPTNIVGEPGGVAFLEHMRARNLSDDEILADFTRRLENIGSCAIAYDHPYYAGVFEIPLIERLIKIVQDRGFKIVPLGELTRK